MWHVKYKFIALSVVSLLFFQNFTSYLGSSSTYFFKLLSRSDQKKIAMPYENLLSRMYLLSLWEDSEPYYLYFSDIESNEVSGDYLVLRSSKNSKDIKLFPAAALKSYRKLTPTAYFKTTKDKSGHLFLMSDKLDRIMHLSVNSQGDEIVKKWEVKLPQSVPLKTLTEYSVDSSGTIKIGPYTLTEVFDSYPTLKSNTKKSKTYSQSLTNTLDPTQNAQGPTFEGFGETMNISSIAISSDALSAYVLDYEGTLFKVSLADGKRTIVSGTADGRRVGKGGEIEEGSNLIHVHASGDVYIFHEGARHFHRVDTKSGDRVKIGTNVVMKDIDSIRLFKKSHKAISLEENYRMQNTCLRQIDLVTGKISLGPKGCSAKELRPPFYISKAQFVLDDEDKNVYFLNAFSYMKLNLESGSFVMNELKSITPFSVEAFDMVSANEMEAVIEKECKKWTRRGQLCKRFLAKVDLKTKEYKILQEMRPRLYSYMHIRKNNVYSIRHRIHLFNDENSNILMGDFTLNKNEYISFNGKFLKKNFKVGKLTYDPLRKKIYSISDDDRISVIDPQSGDINRFPLCDVKELNKIHNVEPKDLSFIRSTGQLLVSTYYVSKLSLMMVNPDTQECKVVSGYSKGGVIVGAGPNIGPLDSDFVMAADSQGSYAYLLADLEKNGTEALRLVQINLKNGKREVIHTMVRHPFDYGSTHLHVSKDGGTIYGSSQRGFLWSYDLKKNVEKTLLDENAGAFNKYPAFDVETTSFYWLGESEAHRFYPLKNRMERISVPGDGFVFDGGYAYDEHLGMFYWDDAGYGLMGNNLKTGQTQWIYK